MSAKEAAHAVGKRDRENCQEKKNPFKPQRVQTLRSMGGSRPAHLAQPLPARPA
jgi:hypothetical protein